MYCNFSADIFTDFFKLTAKYYFLGITGQR